ncbi:MATE family efflux transporter, partial [bacterium]|nr:MATE family efflux transporter [bacterium]
MSQSRSQRLSDEIIGDTPLVSVAFKLGWPAVATMYLIGSFNFIDTKFAGYLGETALAGISTGAFLYWDLIGLGNLVSIGTGAILARRMGERHQAEAERVAYQGVLASLIFSALVSAAFFLAAPWIFAHVMKTDPEVTRVGLSYLHIIVAGAPLIYLLITTNQIMQSLGDTRRPMELMIFALVVTIVLDYALMLGKWGAPAMGAPGAAVATVVSRGLYAVLALGMLASSRWYPGFRLSPHGSWGIDWSLLKRIAAIGLPTCVEATLFPAVYMVLVGYIVPYGNEHVAAMRVGHTIEGLTFFASLGMGMAMRPLVGQNLGAGQPDRAA